MKQLVFIDGCIRGEASRTRSVAVPLLQALEKRYEIHRMDLSTSTLEPVTADLYARRGTEGLSAEDVAAGRLVAQADRIVIAAPFWDMSFPSVLKVFFEHISAPDLTFLDVGDGTTKGNCRAKKLLYITTRGMEIPTGDPRDQGSSYLKALGWLWGIPEVLTVAAYGMDVVDDQTRARRLTEAVAQGLKICEDF
ncbi:MAG: NAD(P)H-dependent oxidoreductase [Clostridia bacterium]|nr:NAD(P)H-dependent oxidoreductase [Clostridia bacterium]